MSDGVSEADCDSLGVPVTLADSDWLGLALCVEEGVSVIVALEVWVGVMEELALLDCEADCDCVLEGVLACVVVSLGDTVGLGDCVGVGLELCDRVPVSEGVCVSEGVEVGVLVPVPVGEMLLVELDERWAGTLRWRPGRGDCLRK